MRSIKSRQSPCADIELPVQKYRELMQVRQGLTDARAMLAETDPEIPRHGRGRDCDAGAPRCSD